ncbi:MAG: UbiX family flavin prenyltransferase [Bacteroidia bacterium]
MKKIVVAITGASGSIYAKRLLGYLTDFPIEVGVVLSENAPQVWNYELQEPFSSPFKVYDRKDYFAPFASGSAGYTHMVIIPCSMGTVGRVVAGLSDDLITRAADVVLKEKRTLIVVPRETPLSELHLRNLLQLAQWGAHIIPAIPSFYSHPTSIEALVDTVVFRVLDRLGLPVPTAFRWSSTPGGSV